MMNMRIIATIVACLLVVIPSGSSLAEMIEGGGGQTRGYSGRNAELTGKMFLLPRSGTIANVEGAGTAGFWIETGNGTLVANFDSFNQARGFALGAGSYRVLPNLKNGSDRAWVRITVNCP